MSAEEVIEVTQLPAHLFTVRDHAKSPVLPPATPPQEPEPQPLANVPRWYEL